LAEITVHQPIGADTDLVLEPLPGWDLNDPIEAWAYARTDQVIGSVPVTVTSQGIAFVYQQQMAEQSVAYYKVLKPGKTFLPLVLKRHSQASPACQGVTYRPMNCIR
jgi:hypothetical protein